MGRELFVSVPRLTMMLALLGLFSCSVSQREAADQSLINADFKIELSQYQHSPYKQVEAQFTTEQNLQLVFRVLSDLQRTAQWFEHLQAIETLEIYSNQQFLLRTIIKSPWPLTDRELITCVATNFEPKRIQIRVSACSDRYPPNPQWVRVSATKATWTLLQQASGAVLVNYKAWLDPNGNVPALFYNQQLIASTTASLHQLIKLIESSSLQQYAY
ncbi:START domain-containing protein [Agarivorans sp. QJM3NY_33]|uniref:START domain-containing protein n=1 Tax=Agarivorans sp. QJM3NY_33 TaxID=3421432 RepID=UPI003D7EE604